MRLYVLMTCMEALAKELLQRDLATLVITDAQQTGAIICGARRGCVLCRIYSAEDVPTLLHVWSKEGQFPMEQVGEAFRLGGALCVLCAPENLAKSNGVRSLYERLTDSEKKASGLPHFDGGGLIRAIAQDTEAGIILMDAFMDEKAYRETLRTGRAVYYSRSREKLWRKGEESGHVQLVREIRINCNGDALLLLVEQIGGAACHDGYRTCYYRRLDPQTGDTTVIEERLFDPAQVYKKKGS